MTFLVTMYRCHRYLGMSYRQAWRIARIARREVREERRQALRRPA